MREYQSHDGLSKKQMPVQYHAGSILGSRCHCMRFEYPALVLVTRVDRRLARYGIMYVSVGGRMHACVEYLRLIVESLWSILLLYERAGPRGP